jgi:hypothetical protein
MTSRKGIAPRSDEGIRERHTRSCKSKSSQPCSCTPSWEAFVYIAHEKRKLRKTFASVKQAKLWRAEQLTPASKGALRSPSTISVRKAAEAWIALAESGEIVNRSGDPYKPSALRGLAQALRLRIVPALGVGRHSVSVCRCC